MRKLAKKRLKKNFQQSLKYLVLVFNDFFVLALIFLFGALMFWYAQSMKVMPENLWFYRPIVGALLSLPIFVGKLVTLIQPADLQFLLPEDENMLIYLAPMLKYSLLVPVICLLFLAGILFPFATIKALVPSLTYVIAVLAVLAAKILQLKVMEYNLFFTRKVSLITVNLLFLAIFTFALIWPQTIYIIAILLIIILLFLLLKPQNVTLFDWRYAVKQEQNRKSQIYNVFSMFTDVKEKVPKIKRRKYLDFLLPKSLAKENPNGFLYRRSLLRNPENLNLLVRMTAFAVLISWLVQNWLWALGLSCLVVFLTVYQLLPMASEFDDNIMYRIYPIESAKRGQDLVMVLALALIMQWLIISLFWLLILPINLQLFEASGLLLIFSLLVGRLYLPIKIKQRKI
ncbi:MULTISPECIES: ABC transporter permease [unclassified Lactobacillus]|uniref:ABC transporter permease n=1 Tax=unclassified Lactobacillus TaxID=2620435 RepID=UPI000EFABF7A|nr:MULTISPECIES: ABC transporter permease [unclassified Lactobacillus]RMC24221.1 ABC transporter permease [Lactobacillus sp. ESL0247]RMC28794.1 ABC transporter permease [Lactobacillus sp. ESL0246]RMC31451.1 ABC transporter permease [Lactobacillus sp. ESL0245]